MRVRLSGDGATVEQIRSLAAACSRAGIRQAVKVGCDGPEKFSFETEILTPNQFATVAAELVKHEGETLASIIDALKEAS